MTGSVFQGNFIGYEYTTRSFKSRKTDSYHVTTLTYTARIGT